MTAGHDKHLVTAGVSLAEADKVLIMLHGRGADANDILSLSNYLQVGKAHIIAPQATNHTWYPHGFMAPVTQNEPWLSSALELLKSILNDVTAAGFNSKHVYILGFSQGACLSLEFAARNAQPFGGVVAFTGGLIGQTLNTANYLANFQQTKIFIGNSDRDPHVPLSRSEESKHALEKLNAMVTLKVYKDMPHTIVDDELDWVNKNLLR